MGNTTTITTPSFSSKDIKRDYFNQINHTIISFKNNNTSNPLNYSIALDRKDFDKSLISSRIKINSNETYIHWKKYLLNYLLKQAKIGIHWALELYLIINNEDYVHEKLWQDTFFYQEFKILTQPKCLREYEYHNHLKETSEFSTSAHNFKNNFMGSFLSSSFESFHSNLIIRKDKQRKIKTKQYVECFYEHIFNKDHPINAIVQEFIKLFIIDFNKVKKQIEDRDMSQSDKKKKHDSIINQLKEFIIEMQVVLKSFYSNTISYQYFIEEKDAIINLLTSLVFSNDTLYQSIYALVTMVKNDQVIRMRNQLKKFKLSRPEDLGIPTQFCLNNTTKQMHDILISNHQKNIKEKGKGNDSVNNDNSNEEKIHIEPIRIDISNKGNRIKKDKSFAHESKSFTNNISYSNNNDTIGNMSEIHILSENQKMDIFIKKSNKQKTNYYLDYPMGRQAPPYLQAIQLLKSLENCHLPFEKMMRIATISSRIKEAIDEYWKDTIDEIDDPSLLNLSFDHLQNLFIYITIQSEMAELIIHSEIVNLFTTPMTKTTQIGYYYSAFEASINYILDASFEN